MRRRVATERVELPEQLTVFAEHRIHDLLRACVHEPNMLRSLMLSCYLQGLADGAQVVEQRPEIIQELKAIRAGADPTLTPRSEP